MSSESDQLFRMRFDLEAADWHNHAYESLWVKRIRDSCFQIDNIPFHAYGIALGDIVTGVWQEGELICQKVVTRSGNSTYRIMVCEKSMPLFEPHWRPLGELGCEFERKGDLLYAVNVPSSANIHEAYSWLEKGANDGIWDIEEAFCGHVTGFK